MEMYNVTLDVAKREPLTADQVDAAMERLEQYHPALGMSARGWQSATISLPAESLMQAVSGALAVVEVALGAPVMAIEAMPTAEFDARQGWVPMPDLVSVSEAAELLEVSRQRVLQRIADKTMPATRVGRDWVIPRTAVEGDDSAD